MTIQGYIQNIAKDLIQVHAELLDWFDESPAIKDYRPLDEGWTIAEILEHIGLTSHYLLIIIDKAVAKSIRKSAEINLENLLADYVFHYDRLQKIGIHKSFVWERPEHMEPRGEKTELEVKAQLVDQLSRCLNHLNSMSEGQGLLQLTTMTVDGLGKLTVYEYIQFLAMHAKRHLTQMQQNKEEMIQNP